MSAFCEVEQDGGALAETSAIVELEHGNFAGCVLREEPGFLRLALQDVHCTVDEGLPELPKSEPHLVPVARVEKVVKGRHLRVAF